MKRTIIALLFSLVCDLFYAKDATIAFVLAEREYDTVKTVPSFYESELKPLGFRATYIIAPDDGDGRNDLKGMEQALDAADLLFVSVRRRAPKISQMNSIRSWVKAGKPVVAIRTASHAFHLRGKAPAAGHAIWEGWMQRCLEATIPTIMVPTKRHGLGSSLPQKGILYSTVCNRPEKWPRVARSTKSHR